LDATLTTRASALLHQPVEEQVGEQKGGEVVDGKGAFEPVSGEVPGVPVGPGIVDQHIKVGKGVKHFVGQPPHFRLR
jgi:hypothetical protein